MPEFRPQTKVAVLLGVFAVTAMLSLGKDFLMPLALAVLIAFLITPVVARLERWGLGHSPAVIVTTLAAFIAIGLSLYVVQPPRGCIIITSSARCNPGGVDDVFLCSPRVTSLARQPWADGCYPVGLNGRNAIAAAETQRFAQPIGRAFVGFQQSLYAKNLA